MKKSKKRLKQLSIVVIAILVLSSFLLGKSNLSQDTDQYIDLAVNYNKSVGQLPERSLFKEYLNKFQQKFFANVLAEHRPPKNFLEAKMIARKIYADHSQTFYCGCHFDKAGNIDLKSCGYKIQQDLVRANRIEWEHIVPISHIAAHLPCWQQKLCTKANGKPYKGRSCCQEIDAVFAKMEADLHNLVPEIGELNACRSNFRFAILPHVELGQFGECHFKIDKETRRVEPKRELRGMIARTYLYISDRYGLQLSDSQRQLFSAWNKENPPDAWEIERDQRIAKVQGNHNPYVSSNALCSNNPVR